MSPEHIELWQQSVCRFSLGVVAEAHGTTKQAVMAVALAYSVEFRELGHIYSPAWHDRERRVLVDAGFLVQGRSSLPRWSLRVPSLDDVKRARCRAVEALERAS